MAVSIKQNGGGNKGMKKLLSPGTTVVFENTIDKELSGKVGTVVGMSDRFEDFDFYIVRLDEVYYGSNEITIIERCIRVQQ